ncbi:alpha/beta fold hydrolase [Actibacterium sp. 188UL27-1]|uniref:alpha/beta fold hydrolase n=1 Tax=Actibacterium sp. 188UL27-1 TaxID=2786961 RepID=UPI001959E3CF|nr:alpha/beta hydrolase [Actibacterium sp. 188UL27-1]MBM7068502.1 alpha/beta hydrolase [Actibacterium sp. 188UL27-1]
MALSGFDHQMVDTGAVRLSVHRGGAGVPLILLHGYPQNHHCWAKVAPHFAERFDVIVPDLRGYGESDAPPDDSDHTVYAKRTMAQDIVGLMDALNLEQAHVLGHDRGGRVAYRMALDHPSRVSRLGIVEIATTADYWANWHASLAMKAYHWTFLAQPSPLPERMIGADPTGYIDWTLASWTGHGTLSDFPEPSLISYRAQAEDPTRLHAMCADYRAGASTDWRIDEEDQAAGRKLPMPICFLAAEDGFPMRTGDPAEMWRAWADDLTTATCQSGHFIMEENPDAVVKTFLPFFLAAR